MHGFLFLPRYVKKSSDKEIKMNQNQLREQLKIIKMYAEVDNKCIAEWLDMKNERSVSNYLHGDFNLSEEKRRKAEEFVLLYRNEALERIYAIF